MRHFFTFLFFCFSTVLVAQDTVVVQTFVWESDTRASTFQFPDDTTQTYRKIWMRYNMRCHDNAVGNGNVGCREWDYSCNTFITDPSRVDSTRVTGPNYEISNFNGQEFGYTTSPTFTYFQFDHHHTKLTGTGSTYQIGNGNAELELAPGKVGRWQFIISAAELQSAGVAAGKLSALQMDVRRIGTSIGFFNIKMKHTTLTELDPGSIQGGLAEVYLSNTPFDATGWKDFNFYQDFDWDGVSNLLVEFSYSTSGTGAVPEVAGHYAGFPAAARSVTADHALRFNGSGSVSIPAGQLQAISGEITISLWAFGDPGALPANTYAFEGVDAGNNRQVNVHLPWNNSQVYWDCGNDGDGYDRINKAAANNEIEGRWNHWAFTKNTSTGVMNIYLNGELWHSGTGKFKPIDIQKLVLAANKGFGTHYFGNLDEFRVWNKELDAQTIKDWMLRKVIPSHPYYDNLLACFRMDEGQGDLLKDEKVAGPDARIYLPDWIRLRGKDLYKNFEIDSLRPNIRWLQGNYTREDSLLPVIDSVQNPLHQVVVYEVDGTDRVPVDTLVVYRSGPMDVVNETGTVVDSVWVPAEDTLVVEDLIYYEKQAAKYEILSLVTPYGNGLSLGANGKTFLFDVTDYAPILQGEKLMSVEMGGQWQEELDIQFIYVTGTPEREVKNIQNIWPFRRGWFAEIQNDRYFEPRSVRLDKDGDMFKLRSAVTGHGQNGEFVPRQHYINVNGGNQEFRYDVWKYCGKNPIYPQGGTWIFDRAGWCPGAATDVHQFDLTPFAVPGGSLEVDYGVNGAFMDMANYLVSNQLVTYSPYNFSTDASLESVIRPNNSRVEYERVNPACNMPVILVRNSGANTINSIEIEYKVRGGDVLTYVWEGDLAASQNVEIELPVTAVSFWDGPGAQIFEVTLNKVNGAADDYSDNNYASSGFDKAKLFDFTDPLILDINTNLEAHENSYTITDSEGNVVMERDNMQNSTRYLDEVNLPAGCYTLNFEDTGNDGLYFWFFPENGNGSLRFNRVYNGQISLPVQSFLSDNGGGVQFDFIKSAIVGSKDIDHYQLFSVYPNPASEEVHIDMHGFPNTTFQLQLLDLTGKIIRSELLEVASDPKFTATMWVGGLPGGVYYLRVSNEKNVWVRELILMN